MIERVLRAACTRRTLVLAATGVVLLVSAALVWRLSFDADVLRLLPQKGPAVSSFAAYLEHFGTLDHVYILFEVPPGARISDRETLVDRYVDELRKAPEIVSVDAELFDAVKDWDYLFDRTLLLLGPADARRALDRLTPEAMAGELERSRGLLTMASPDVKAYVQRDPLGLLRMMRDRLSRGQSLVSFDPTQRGYVSRDGRSRLVVAKPRRPPFDTAFCQALFARLAIVESAARAAAAADEEGAVAEGATDVTVQVAGGYRISLEAERIIRVETIINALTSLVGLLLLVFVVFRTPWILVYGTLPLVVAAAFTLGVNGLGGPLSPATSGASAMLFGLGIDGIILLYLRFAEERQRGQAPAAAMVGSAGTARSILLGYTTTAATFLALLVVDFPSLEELGRLVGLGILACAVAVLTLLPALVCGTMPRRLPRPVTAAWLARLVERRRRAMLVGAAIATVLLGLAATRLRLDTSLDRLQAQTEGAALEQHLAEQFALPREVVLAMAEGPDLEPLLGTLQRAAVAVGRRLPALAASSPDLLLPPAADQQAVADLLGARNLEVATIGADLEERAQQAGFRPGTFHDFVGRLPRILSPAERITYEGLIAHGLEPLISRFVAPTAAGYRVAAYFYPKTVAERAELVRVVTAAAPSLTMTGVGPVNEELAARFLPQFLRGLLAGVAVVALMIYLAFRSVRRTMLAFLPTLVGFVWAAGVLALWGIVLDLFSMFAALTFIGIATDYAVHLIHRQRIEGGGTVPDVLTHTGAGILVACGTTLIGFGSLVGSSYGPLHSFGVTSIVTITACLVASLLVLPALIMEMDRS